MKRLIAALLITSSLMLTGCFGGSISDMADGLYIKEGSSEAGGFYICFDGAAQTWRCSFMAMNYAESGSFTVNWRRIVLSCRAGKIVLREGKYGSLEVLSVDVNTDEYTLLGNIAAGDRFVKYDLPAESEQPGEEYVDEVFDKILPAEEALAYARGAGYTVMEDGICTSGKAQWRGFFKAVASHESATAYTASCYTLDEDHIDPDYYNEIKDNYPVTYFSRIDYDGETFRLTVRDSSKEELDSEVTFKYMLHFSGKTRAGLPYYDSYMLVDDPDVTYERLWAGVLSSQSGDAINFRQVYSDRTNKAPLSQLSAKEQIEFLKKAGIDIPSYMTAESDFIPDLIRRAEADPCYRAVLSNPVALRVADEICSAVNDYYDAECELEDPEDHIYRELLTNCTKEGVDEFMEAFAGADVSKQDYSDHSSRYCYNVTPDDVYEKTGVRIFKFGNSSDSYAFVNGKVCELCWCLGGHGFVDAVPYDHDGDGRYDILLTSSAGSGTHWNSLSFFDVEKMESKKIPMILSDDHSSHWELALNINEDGNSVLVMSVEKDGVTVIDNNMAYLRLRISGAVGVVEGVDENGLPAFRRFDEE